MSLILISHLNLLISNSCFITLTRILSGSYVGDSINVSFPWKGQAHRPVGYLQDTTTLQGLKMIEIYIYIYIFLTHHSNHHFFRLFTMVGFHFLCQLCHNLQLGRCRHCHYRSIQWRHDE
jgi:hypothetical protein